MNESLITGDAEAIMKIWQFPLSAGDRYLFPNFAGCLLLSLIHYEKVLARRWPQVKYQALRDCFVSSQGSLFLDQGRYLRQSWNRELPWRLRREVQPQ